MLLLFTALPASDNINMIFKDSMQAEVTAGPRLPRPVRSTMLKAEMMLLIVHLAPLHHDAHKGRGKSILASRL